MFEARRIVELSRSCGIDPFDPDAVQRLAAMPAAQPAIKAIEIRFPGHDPVAIVTLALQAVEIEVGDPRGIKSNVTCVATLPEAINLEARPTRIVIREMLQAARRTVLAAGYLITEASEFLPLAHLAAARNVDFCLVCDRSRDDARRIQSRWPSGIRPPRILVNREVKVRDATMHAKVLVADHQELLVTSANFTLRGHTANIEYGLYLRGDEARRTAIFFQALEDHGLLVPFSVQPASTPLS